MFIRKINDSGIIIMVHLELLMKSYEIWYLKYLYSNTVFYKIWHTYLVASEGVSYCYVTCRLDV